MSDKTGTGSYAGSAVAAIAGLLTFEQWAVAISIVFAAGTFAINWWYKRKLVRAQVEAAKAKADYYSGDRHDTN